MGGGGGVGMRLQGILRHTRPNHGSSKGRAAKVMYISEDHGACMRTCV